MDAPRSLKEILLERMGEKDYDNEKLTSASGVNKLFIESIIGDEVHDPPSLPYSRGYCQKIATALECDPEEIWNAYQREHQSKTSGSEDAMPKNRFAIEAMNKRWLLWTTLSVIVVGYGILNINRILGTPNLTIILPGTQNVIVDKTTLVVKGSVENPKDTVTINGASIVVDPQGFFEKIIELEEGPNIVTVVAKRFLGKEKQITIQAIYNTPAPPIENTIIKK